MCGIFCAVVPRDSAIPRPDHLLDPLTRDMLERRGPDLGRELTVITMPDGDGTGTDAGFELQLFARVLHLQGDVPAPQPAVDVWGNVLLWNGEVFGGLKVPPGESDTSTVLRALAGDDNDREDGSDDSESAILSTLSRVQGPWALIYYHYASRCLWFGRDCFGRRSLLWLFPKSGGAVDDGGSTVEPRWFVISSVASQQVPASARWLEVPADGVYKVHLGSGGSGTSGLNVEWFPWRWSPLEQVLPFGMDGATRTTPDTQDKPPTYYSDSLPDISPHPLRRTGGEIPTEEEQLPSFFCVTRSDANPGLCSVVPDMNMSVPHCPSPRPQGPHLLGPDVISERMVAARQLVEALDEAVRLRCIPRNSGGGGGGGSIVGGGSGGDGGRTCNGSSSDSTSGSGVHSSSGAAGDASVAVLFSGGLDCMVLAALAHRHTPAHEPIDLLNVAFECWRPGNKMASSRQCQDHRRNPRKLAKARKGDPPYKGIPDNGGAKDEHSNSDVTAVSPLPSENGGDKEEMAIGGRGGGLFDVPDRLSARAGLEELRALFPRRRWRLIGVDVCADELASARAHRIAHLVHPACSVLDDALGCALWFAARGRGGLILNGRETATLPDERRISSREPGSPSPGSPSPGLSPSATTTTMPEGLEPFVSRAKVLLSGLGADEQLAGYSRHAARFRQGGWSALAVELRTELSRIGRRNLGRDDRVTADHGKETRFPYLDEAVVALLSALPAHVKAEPGAARGIGEKLLLRQAALVHLGLAEASARPKRAMQFGSRIAHMERDGARQRGSDSCSRLVQPSQGVPYV